MTTNARSAAVSHLVDRDYLAAAQSYTHDAHRRFGGSDTGSTLLEPGGRGRTAKGLASLTLAGLCFRLVGLDDRGETRCREVELLAGEQRDHVREGVESALFSEFVGDARAVRGADPGDAYTDAADRYRACAPVDPMEQVTAPTFDAANEVVLHASRNTSAEVAWDDIHGSDTGSVGYLTHRPAFKRRTFPGVVDAVLDAGILHVPRGTTEFNNANFRCPDCDRTDVNWVAGETVCLHCSVRMADR
ncbi:hypothetical protein [Haloarcula marina]|uniref:hypothetical protein n=1 Tax=Haloarcula marina TaxID=2961574 RepID=UPI0020B74FAE|nr:hypothetical protein [Halomicroarcula marina]